MDTDRKVLGTWMDEGAVGLGPDRPGPNDPAVASIFGEFVQINSRQPVQFFNELIF
jgi:hypothetical protein